MARPRRSLLTRQRIVAAAIELIDSDGLAAMSTRALAARLGVRGPSLYNHFATKDDILDAVADAVIADVDIAAFGRLDWATALRVWARSYHDALRAHPNVVPYLALGPGRRPAALAMADAVYGGLVDAGWPPAWATRIGAATRYFVAGSALGSFARGFVEDPSLYAGRYPRLRDAHRLAEHQHDVDEGAFALGLDALVDGLARLRPAGVAPDPDAGAAGRDRADAGGRGRAGGRTSAGSGTVDPGRDGGEGVDSGMLGSRAAAGGTAGQEDR